MDDLQRARHDAGYSRRRFGTVVAMSAAYLLNACSGRSKGSTAPTAAVPARDLSAQFAGYTATEEPDADPTKVVWPDFVKNAPDDVRRLYEFQLTNGALMRYIPCFCGCNSGDHFNNRDCYIKQVNPDGSAVFDSMAPT